MTVRPPLTSSFEGANTHLSLQGVDKVHAEGLSGSGIRIGVSVPQASSPRRESHRFAGLILVSIIATPHSAADSGQGRRSLEGTTWLETTILVSYPRYLSGGTTSTPLFEGFNEPVPDDDPLDCQGKINEASL